MLLKRKSVDAIEAALEAQAEGKVWRTTIREQQNSASVQIETDEEITILPYAYFQEARCRKQGKSWEITLYWPWVIVRLTGGNLEKLPGMIAEHGLACLKFHAEGERVQQDDRPELESVALIPRAIDPALPLPAGAKFSEQAKAIHRYTQSVG